MCVRGRAIAQAVSRWLPTVAARVRAWVWSSDICLGQIGAGAGFLRVLRFTLPIFIPPNSPPSQSAGVCTISRKWPMCRADPLWTPSPLCEFKKNYVCNRVMYWCMVMTMKQMFVPSLSQFRTMLSFHGRQDV
jgi:hypothetical protein